MNKSDKEQSVAELNQAFKDHQTVILLEFKGIDVPDITQLRDKIRETGSSYRVIKNRLAIRAAAETPVEPLNEFFTGPTAIAATTEDSVALAKVLKDFVKESSGMSFKAAVVDGQTISVGELEALADLPSREELLTKLLFVLNAPVTQLARVLQSPLTKLALLLKQFEGKKER